MCGLSIASQWTALEPCSRRRSHSLLTLSQEPQSEARARGPHYTCLLAYARVGKREVRISTRGEFDIECSGTGDCNANLHRDAEMDDARTSEHQTKSIPAGYSPQGP